MDTPTAQTQKTEEKVLPESERNEKPNRLDEKAKEVQKLQAMMGSNKQQEAKFVVSDLIKLRFHLSSQNNFTYFNFTFLIKTIY